jgi:hypothetical protein
MTTQDTALRMIKEYGVAVPLVRNSGNYDPVSGSRANDALSFTPYAVPISETIENGNVTSVYMFDTTVEPLEGDKATIDGQVNSISKIDVIKDQLGPVYYEVTLTR